MRALGRARAQLQKTDLAERNALADAISQQEKATEGKLPEMYAEAGKPKAQRSLAAGVRFFTGRHYAPSGRALPFVRLGFGHLDEDELTEAARRMARCLTRA